MGLPRLLGYIMGVREEYTLDKMFADGWEDTGKTHSGNPIYALGNERILYDLNRDEIITRYNIKDE